MSFVTHLACSWTGKRHPAHRLQGLSDAGKPLLVHYDLRAVGAAIDRDALRSRPEDLWRYRELLPLPQGAAPVSLGEAWTPLLPLRRGNVWIKDEGRLPTGSFKARGIALAVSMARHFGVRKIALPTNGNAGAALAAYASRAGMESVVFCPEDTPEINLREIQAQGATLRRVAGLIHDCGRLVAAGTECEGWFDLSTLKEPYRIEGKKTMGLELAEQLGWELPEVILYPTGGGTGLIGMWKAFQELAALGWIDPARRPRMVAVQAAGCAPIVRAFQAGTETATLWAEAHTVAAGIRVPAAIGDFLILRAVRESGGFAAAVEDAAILAAREAVAREEGILLCPEGAATYAAYLQELRSGRIGQDERAVLFNCASGLKYDLPPVTGPVERVAPA
ncbi:MAG TPA: threonine synthase [Candidatus Polarisedimenticolaceae bacterium]|nr:threonine synthase [Candidatus Polarisedimenticolaceae bacterium]